MRKHHYLKSQPDEKGYFGDYGGAFLPPQLVEEFERITEAYLKLRKSHAFISELRRIRAHYQGRPTPVYHARRLSEALGGAQLYFKREDLNHTGAHKLNHCMAEALLAKSLGKRKLIAETGAGQHGVALATACAYFGLACEIHMGEVDIEKEHPNVVRMKILGAEVVPATHGLKTLKEAVDSAFESYVKQLDSAMYAIGSVVGPHPFPLMVRDFQSIVGMEAREQFMAMTDGELPDHVVACVGGGSNAMGIFSGFIDDPVELYAVEPLGRSTRLGDHAATLEYGKEGVLHGFKSILLQTDEGEPAPVHSIASGLDYPGVGPEHAYLHDIGRVHVKGATDQETVEAFYAISQMEGIIPALESSHAIAYAMRLAKEVPHDAILVNLSGRGDKDIDYVVENFGVIEWSPEMVK